MFALVEANVGILAPLVWFGLNCTAGTLEPNQTSRLKRLVFFQKNVSKISKDATKCPHKKKKKK